MTVTGILWRRMGVAALMCASLGACATVPTAPTASTTPATTAVADDVAIEQRIGTLPPQELEDGSCGMFLWARDSHRNLVFFTSDRTRQAHLVLDGQQIALPRTVAEGDLVFGQYTRQEFSQAGIDLRLVVQPDPDSGIIGGAVVRQGMLNIRDAKGWDFVLPVAGLIACKGA